VIVSDDDPAVTLEGENDAVAGRQRSNAVAAAVKNDELPNGGRR